MACDGHAVREVIGSILSQAVIILTSLTIKTGVCLTRLTAIMHLRFRPMSYRKQESDNVRSFKTDTRYQTVSRQFSDK